MTLSSLLRGKLTSLRSPKRFNIVKHRPPTRNNWRLALPIIRSLGFNLCVRGNKVVRKYP